MVVSCEGLKKQTKIEGILYYTVWKKNKKPAFDLHFINHQAFDEQLLNFVKQERIRIEWKRQEEKRRFFLRIILFHEMIIKIETN